MSPQLRLQVLTAEVNHQKDLELAARSERAAGVNLPFGAQVQLDHAVESAKRERERLLKEIWRVWDTLRPLDVQWRQRPHKHGEKQ